MKKVAIVLVVVMVIGLLAGVAYALSDGFKKVPWEKDPTTESNILTESQDLLNNHASITFGTGDSAWTISTTDEFKPIYIDDLRAPGKGLKIADEFCSSGGGTGALSNSGINVSGKNLISVALNVYRNNDHVNFETDLNIENNQYVLYRATGYFYENIFYSLYKRNDDYNSSISYEEKVRELEEKIAKECVAGDNYFLGCHSIAFAFADMEKYPNYNIYGIDNCEGISTYITINIPVYYRVK